MWKRIKYHPLVIRLLHWEYWPVYVSNIPVFFFWIFHAVRARDPFFFSAVNPSIPTGGLFGEEKHCIYSLIPSEYLPKTLFLSSEEEKGQAPECVREAGMQYPLVCKPNIGERGMQVAVIDGPENLSLHIRKMTGGVIIQEYIDYPVELSVLCHRFPHSDRKGVTSICEKAFLTVTGDGKRTLSELIDLNPRAILQKKTLSRRVNLRSVPRHGEVVLLEAIGNHCRGTQFLNANHLISPDLQDVMLQILDQMPGVHYGRFDLRTASIESLAAGRDFLIMEFNGVGSEPAHIYDPGYSPFRAYGDLWKHWRLMYEIAQEQKAHGVASMHWRHGLESLRKYFSYKKRANLAYDL